ncbi:TadE/TadG family type IV pilus assembly protein [Rhodopseudomonas palustris]|uniref:TadE-like n=1 Tax=Rhodopseudomonas palustris (strain BisB18) TaxID=316056 RepID=Q210E4_RHOPB
MPSCRFLPIALRALRGFRRHRRGSAAVEFALVAPIFIALLFAIIEVALVFFAGQLLETGTQDAARVFLTQTNPALAEDFKKLVCNRVDMLLSCATLRVDVQSFAPGAAIDIKNPIVNGSLVDSFVYQLPPHLNSNYTVVVRTFYQWPLFVTKLGFNLSNVGEGTRLLAATAALRPQ